MHGLNEELGRHRGRECSLCGDKFENVSHVLLECSAYSRLELVSLRSFKSC